MYRLQNTQIMRSFLLFILAFSLNQIAYSQIQGLTDATINALGVKKLVLDLNGSETKISRTKGNRIIVEMTIAFGFSSESLLNQMIANGRYDVEQQLDSETATMRISPKKLKSTINIKGEEIYEKVSYNIAIPEHIEYEEVVRTSASK